MKYWENDLYGSKINEKIVWNSREKEEDSLVSINSWMRGVSERNCGSRIQKVSPCRTIPSSFLLNKPFPFSDTSSNERTHKIISSEAISCLFLSFVWRWIDEIENHSFPLSLSLTLENLEEDNSFVFFSLSQLSN